MDAKLTTLLRRIVLEDNGSSYKEEVLDYLLDQVHPNMITIYIPADTSNSRPGRNLEIPAELYLEIRRFMSSNQKINAIKSLRAFDDMGLKQAKDAVEHPGNF
jgi:hypothetical protein